MLIANAIVPGSVNFVGLTNLSQNPSFETDTANWATSGGGLNNGATLTRVTTQHESGVAAGQIATTGALQGAINTLAAVTSGQLYTASVWLKGNAGGEPTAIQLGDSAHSDVGSATFHTLTTAFQQFTCTWTPSSNHASAALIVQQSNTAGSNTFFVDAILVVAGTSTTFFDGNSSGCVWNGTTNDSTSSQATTTQGDGVSAVTVQAGFRAALI